MGALPSVTGEAPRSEEAMHGLKMAMTRTSRRVLFMLLVLYREAGRGDVRRREGFPGRDWV